MLILMKLNENNDKNTNFENKNEKIYKFFIKIVEDKENSLGCE